MHYYCSKESGRGVDKTALTSIQPPHTDNIFSGRKRVEWRTKPMPEGKHYCYETKNGGGCGMVIGEYTVSNVKRFDTVHEISETYISLGCVPRDFLVAYSRGRALYAHLILFPRRYAQPVEISTFSKYGFENRIPLTRPPQSWCYVYKTKGDNK